MKAMENFKQTCPHDAFCGGCTYQDVYKRQDAMFITGRMPERKEGKPESR